MRVSNASRVPGINVVAAALLVAGCGDAAEPGGSEVARRYAAELNVDLDRMEARPGGLRVYDIETGTGEPAERGQVVAVHYTGWLPDGTEFDSSRNRGLPLETLIGAGQVIAGWDEGIPGMRPGGRRQLVIPPDMGYGAEGFVGVIPPNATLVFDVELIEAWAAGGEPQ